MPDDSELDYLKTFIEEATTALIVNTYETIRKLKRITTGKKCLIEPGEFLSIDGQFYKKRYRLLLTLENEVNMTSILNEIIDGIVVFNKRGAGFTYPSVMCNITFRYSTKFFAEGSNKWYGNIYLDIEWVTS